MSAYRELALLPEVTATETGEGGTVDTMAGVGTIVTGSLAVRLFLDVSAASPGDRTLDVEVYGVVGGVEHLLHAFAQLAADETGQQSVIIDACPGNLKVRYTLPAGTGGDFTFAVHAIRG